MDANIKKDQNVPRPVSAVKNSENRVCERFPCSGLASAPGITQNQGELGDLSLFGCRVRFPGIIVFSGDAQYEVHLIPPENVFSTTVSITGTPVWSTYEKDATLIGFSLVSASNTALLSQWVDILG